MQCRALAYRGASRLPHRSTPYLAERGVERRETTTRESADRAVIETPQRLRSAQAAAPVVPESSPLNFVPDHYQPGAATLVPPQGRSLIHTAHHRTRSGLVPGGVRPASRVKQMYFKFSALCRHPSTMVTGTPSKARGLIRARQASQRMGIQLSVGTDTGEHQGGLFLFMRRPPSRLQEYGQGVGRDHRNLGLECLW